MVAVELLEAHLRIQDGSLHHCLDLVLAGLRHLVRPGSLALYLFALPFLFVRLHCSLRPVFLLNDRVRLRTHFCFD